MLRLLGAIVVLLLIVAGLGYYLGWFTISTSNQGGNTHINITVDKEKLEADEKAAKKKLEETEKKIKEKLKSTTEKSSQ